MIQFNDILQKFASIGVKCIQKEAYTGYNYCTIGENLRRNFRTGSYSGSGPRHEEFEKFDIIADVAIILHENQFITDAIYSVGWQGKIYVRFIYDKYIKLEFEFHNRVYSSPPKSINCTAYIRNEFSEYIKHKEYTNLDIPKILLMINEVKTIPKPTYKKKNVVVGEPHDFIDIPEFKFSEYSPECALRNEQLVNNVEFIGVVAISSSGNRDIVDSANPDNPSVWFHIKCYRGHGGYSFDIITDGSVWYQIIKSGKKYKIVPDTKKGTIDLSKLSQLDQRMIQFAISNKCPSIVGA